MSVNFSSRKKVVRLQDVRKLQFAHLQTACLAVYEVFGTLDGFERDAALLDSITTVVP